MQPSVVVALLQLLKCVNVLVSKSAYHVNALNLYLRVFMYLECGIPGKNMFSNGCLIQQESLSLKTLRETGETPLLPASAHSPSRSPAARAAPQSAPAGPGHGQAHPRGTGGLHSRACNRLFCDISCVSEP